MQSNKLSPGIGDPTSEERSATIQQRLRTAGDANLRRIECEYHDGVVVLRGRVPTYYVKQLAQSLLLVDPAVQAIENLIEVAMTGRDMEGNQPQNV